MCRPVVPTAAVTIIGDVFINAEGPEEPYSIPAGTYTNTTLKLAESRVAVPA